MCWKNVCGNSSKRHTTMLPNDHSMIRHRRPLQIGMIGHFSNQKVPLNISAIRKFHWIFQEPESSTEYFGNQKVPLNVSAWSSCRILCRLTESCRLCESWTESNQPPRAQPESFEKCADNFPLSGTDCLRFLYFLYGFLFLVTGWLTKITGDKACIASISAWLSLGVLLEVVNPGPSRVNSSNERFLFCTYLAGIALASSSQTPTGDWLATPTGY